MKHGAGPARWLQSAGLYIAMFFRWALVGAVIGLLGGTVGTLFHLCIKYAAALRMDNPWTLYLMPVGGLLIALMYTATKTPLGTDNVLRAVRSDEKIPALMAPLIFVSTVITQFVGGSAGREGAAIQIGGTLGFQAGRLLRLGEKDSHVLVMCGACSVFSAVFSTPITAAVFALEVISVGEFYYVALVPCVISGIVANEFSSLCGIGPEVFPAVAAPQLAVMPALKIVLLAALCGGISILFCLALHHGERLAHDKIKNAYLRILAGSAVLIALTLLVGVSRFILGVHYPTDVIAGWALGIVIVIFVGMLQEKIQKKWIVYLILTVMTIPGWFYCKSSDFFTGFGMQTGFFLGVLFEEKFIGFENPKKWYVGLIRTVVAIALYYGLNSVLKLPFPKEILNASNFTAYFIRAARYAVVCFLLSGVYPFLFKPLDKLFTKKKKDEE